MPHNAPLGPLPRSHRGVLPPSLDGCAMDPEPPLRSNLADDPDIMPLVREYAACLPSRLAEIESLFQKRELTAVAKLAHQTKGAGGMYGYPELSETAALLEDAVREQQSPDLIGDLIREFGLLVDKIVRGLDAT